jgi:hypothetical protein
VQRYPIRSSRMAVPWRELSIKARLVQNRDDGEIGRK